MRYEIVTGWKIKSGLRFHVRHLSPQGVNVIIILARTLIQLCELSVGRLTLTSSLRTF